MADQTVRVTAKGDFTQLQRGLKQLQGDLKNVTGEIDRGARKGGFFDESQIRALDFFGKRFKSTLQELKDAMAEQGHAFERLLSMAQKAHGAERDAINKEIDARSATIDQIEEQIGALERLYAQRKKEQEQFDRSQKDEGKGASKGGGSKGGTSGNHDVGGSLLDKVLGGGKLLLGMAGIGGIVSVLTEAYHTAYASQTVPLDLAQRMRGYGGRSGNARSQWDVSGDTGRDDNMGYTNPESWQFLDMYSRQVGGVSSEEQKRLMKFGRGYGLTTGEVSGLVGDNVHSGGGQGSKFADAIAGSVAKSGMTPRIVEVMEANNALLKTMNTTLKDGSARQILAYQTSLDKIGNEKGMTQLTGTNGANVISGLGGIFRPGENNWKWMGIRALQQYNPKKYGSMNLFGLESSYEDGLMNTDNIAAMGQYTKNISGGNKDLQSRIMQKWLTDGGFGATKTQASQVWGAIDGGKNLSPEELQKIMNGSVDSGASYDANRKGEAGQTYLQTDSRFQAAMEGIGQPMVTAVQGLKEGVTTGMEKMEGIATAANAGVQSILDFLNGNLKGLAMDANLVGFISSLDPRVKGTQSAFENLYGGKSPSWITSADQLDPANKSFFRDDSRWTGTKMPALDPSLSPDEKLKQKSMYEWLTQQQHNTEVGKQAQEQKKKMDEHTNQYNALPWYDPNKMGNNIGDTIRNGLQWIFGGGGGKKTSLEQPLQDMSDQGVSFFRSMDKNTTDSMTKLVSSMDSFRRAGTGIMMASYMSGGMGGGGGSSGTTLASFGRSSPLTGGKGDFIKQMLPYAQLSSAQTGLPVDFILGQWGHESGWGTSNAATKNNNFAGIKPWGSTGAGANKTYAGYGSLADFANGYADFYNQNGRYKGLLGAAKNGASADQLADIIGTTGYAEDPMYTGKLKGVIGSVDKTLTEGQMAQQLPGAGGNGVVQAGYKTEHTVNVNLSGDGADQLTNLSKEQLIRLIKGIFTEQQRQDKLVNPTRTVLT